ncbi:MAG: Hsp20 family protein [Acidobacteriota bacterium]|nr:MAG: Hsp20 family protein [Acidobacteriota bacterium]
MGESSQAIQKQTDTTAKRETGEDARGLEPVFADAEKLWDKMRDATRRTAEKAYEYFRARGGELGKELEDWFRAEKEILRTVPVEIREKDSKILVSAAIPGFNADQIEVSVKDDCLMISGEREESEEKTEGELVMSEWKSNRFFRKLVLPSPVDEARVKARLRDGILELTLPKAEVEEPRQVRVVSD